ncbi:MULTISPECIES: tripartite tricarboxylate transporter substrate binding protein [unclassified Beijerinckia]|uniref:Bug family tripartite tricarboxylate transporter substrate binding protein n=1 Tax=unclassified Beijerinckia TaxID=2638183 RepID=UPI0008983F87|nr:MULTISPECIES: tripartite tricarboxylate transporter substrate binding protein [unclassified Beijerinckia]MDH7799018.1 tripartite-type tricarboxylate transporter receptor subunit TctC [Beijerinckia sp. GAS462]SED84193.1 Tripartite-type tricarboxylate transporter, receptor component TctC [Beijerinckia sp. 28-YEA-48]
MASWFQRLFMCVFVLCGAWPAVAQNYPSKPIRILIGHPAGSGADVLCRYFADQLGKAINQAVVVENRPGAGGNLATQAVASAKPDGYTLLFSTSNPLTGNFYLYKNVGFKLSDFVPVTILARGAFVLVVSGKSEIRSVADLTKSLREKAGRARYGAPTSIALASAEIYLDAVGASAQRVLYKDGPLAVSELAAGDLDFFFIDSTTVKAPAERGQVRMLAVTPPQRISLAPDVPTMQEQGIADFDMTPWFAMFAPAGVSKEIRGLLEEQLNAIVKMPQTEAFLHQTANDPYPGSADLLMTAVRSQTEKYRRLSEAGKLPVAAE